MSLEQWANDLIKNFYNEWKSNYKCESGFKIFYGPVRKNPKLMILSYNPGGDIRMFNLEDNHRYEKGDFTPPKINSYLERHNLMAKKMQNFFSNHKTVLEESVILPILFFRTKNKREWMNTFTKEKRVKAEKLCEALLEEIIVKINPQNFLIMGMDTFEILEKRFFGELQNKETQVSQNGKLRQRLFIKSTWNGRSIFVIRHPTGSRISNNDWERTKEQFFKML